MVIVYDENGYLVVGSLKLKPKPKESIIIEGFHFSGDFILEYGTVKRRVSEEPRLEFSKNTFDKHKYNLCG